MWMLVLTAIVGVYLCNTYVLRELFSPYVATYVAQPALWIALALLVIRLPRPRPAGRSSLRQSLVVAALMAGVIHLIVLATGGFLCGFGSSPYSFSPTGIMTNIVFVGSALLGRELARAFMVNSLSRKHATLAIAFVALLFTILMIPKGDWTGIGWGKGTVDFLGAVFLPGLAKSLLATFLAFVGGPLPAIAYMGVLVMFEWFSPVLPDLTPMMTALLGTLGPIVGFAFLQYGLLPYYSRTKSRKTLGERKASSLPVGWIAAAVVSVAMIWFSLGLFSVWPNVVYSGSMRPAIEVGDIVIITEKGAAEVSVGDVIAFQRGEDTIIHRVVEISDQETQPVFITKGDANQSADSDPVVSEQVRGRVVLTVPKLGWAAVGVKSWLFADD